MEIHREYSEKYTTIMSNIERIMLEMFEINIEEWTADCINEKKVRTLSYVQELENLVPSLKAQINGLYDDIKRNDLAFFEGCMRNVEDLKVSASTLLKIKIAHVTQIEAQKPDDILIDLLGRIKNSSAWSGKMVESFINTILSIQYTHFGFSEDKEKFNQQSQLAVTELTSRHGVNLEELDVILKDLMCNMDTEVNIESLEGSFDVAERLLIEAKDLISNYQNAVNTFVEVVPDQMNNILSTFLQRVMSFFGLHFLKENESNTSLEKAMITENQAKIPIIVASDHQENVDMYTTSSEVMALDAKGIEIMWLFQRSTDWLKFRHTRPETQKKGKKFNAIWYNSKRNKDKKAAANYDVIINNTLKPPSNHQYTGTRLYFSSTR
jgi:hypothetical protein